MISKHRVLALLLFSSLGCAALAHMAAAAPFTSGNILVTYSNALHEYTLEGEWVQSIPIPHPGSDRYNVTDSVTDRLGRIHLGSSASLAMSFLTTFDPSDGSFRHTPDPTFYLGNVSDGDLTILGDFVWTRNSRLDLRDFSVTNVTVPELSRVGELSIGLDGLLYALSSGSPRPYVHVMDPLTMAGVRELVLRDSAGFRLDARGIAVPENGELYVADWDGRIYHYTPDGVYIEDVLTGGGNMLDINVSPDGTIIAGSRFGHIVVTDTTLESVRGFDVPGGLAYVSFVKDGGGCLVDSDCDDGVFCTVNQCDPVTGECAYDPDDGLCENSEFCDGVEFCDPVAGCQTAEVPDCDDDIDCTLDVCNEVSDECDHTPDHESCSDGLFCNGQEQCDKERGCWAGPLPFCVDRADCTLDSCNEDTDSCDHLPNDGHCDDGFYCTGIEFCDVDWGCQDGDPPCLSGEVCDEIEGCLSAEFLTLDIRPGSCRNPFNPKSRGVLPVALLGTPDFDLSLVDIETMVLTRSDGAGEVFYVIDGPGRLRPVLVDMGTPVHGDSCDCDQSCDCGGLCGCSEPLPDGYLDLLLKFSTHSVTAVLGSVESGAGDSVVLAVSGNFLDGSPFSAVDCVSIVPSSSVISSRGKISRRDP